MRHFKGGQLLPTLVVLFLLSGCGGGPAEPYGAAAVTGAPQVVPTIPMFRTSAPENTKPPAGTPTPDPLAALIEAAQAEGQLSVIALPHDWMNYGEIIQTFSRKYGIAVKELEPNAGSSEELKAIGRGGADAPDVIDVGLTFAEQARLEGLLAPYKVAAWESIPEASKDPDGYWYGDYYGIMVFEVDPKAVASVPQDWADLLIPGNKVAMPAFSGGSYQSTMMIYSASVANGGSLDDTIPGLRFFQDVNHAGNIVRGVVVDGNTVSGGVAPIALRWDYLALANRERQGADRIVVVAPKTGIVAGVYAQAISASAPHPNAAKLWMEFLYSDEGQLLFVEGLGHPIRFADLLERDAIPQYLLDKLLPSELYLRAEFPTANQMSAADKAIVAGWTSYIP